jgi:hypothetical protein
MERLFTASTRLVLALGFAVAVYWAAVRPITAAEAILWNDLVRPPLRVAFFAPDAWSGWLYALLAKRTVGLFRLSEFTLRLPALLACGVYLSVLPRRPVSILLAVYPIAVGLFSTGAGHGVALALCACAWRWRSAAPVLVGFAIVASIPVGLLAIPLLLRPGFESIEKVVIPAVVIAFIVLIVPLSHAEAPVKSAVGSREVEAVRERVQRLRDKPVRFSVTPPLAPILAFYKARYRQRSWEIVDALDASQPGVVVFSQPKTGAN